MSHLCFVKEKGVYTVHNSKWPEVKGTHHTKAGATEDLINNLVSRLATAEVKYIKSEHDYDGTNLNNLRNVSFWWERVKDDLAHDLKELVKIHTEVYRLIHDLKDYPEKTLKFPNRIPLSEYDIGELFESMKSIEVEERGDSVLLTFRYFEVEDYYSEGASLSEEMRTIQMPKDWFENTNLAIREYKEILKDLTDKYKKKKEKDKKIRKKKSEERKWKKYLELQKELEGQTPPKGIEV